MDFYRRGILWFLQVNAFEMPKLLILISVFLVAGCYGPVQNHSKTRDMVTAVSKDFMRFWTYYNRQVKLYKDFIGLDTATNPVDRSTFFKLLSTGRFIPLKMAVDTPTYQLFKLPAGAEPSISLTIQQIGISESKHAAMEGKAMPSFNFTDLDGKTYNAQNTFGKVVVVKCWFVHCQACVAEMPFLNAMVDQYSSHKDVIFISLAFDKPDQLKTFLKQTQFSYPVVPDQEHYLLEELGVEAYPTHIVINRKGRIVRVVENAEAVAYVLAKEVDE
jgi:peroxiredoxin